MCTTAALEVESLKTRSSAENHSPLITVGAVGPPIQAGIERSEFETPDVDEGRGLLLQEELRQEPLRQLVDI